MHNLNILTIFAHDFFSLIQLNAHVLCKFMSTFAFITACRMIVNQSAGLIDVTHAGYSSIYCYWTIGNTGMAQAIGLFLIEEINFGYCRYSHLLRVFDSFIHL